MKEKIIIEIDGYLFDFSSYLDLHPGGAAVLKQFQGKDATNIFNSIKDHNESYVNDLLDRFCIGPKK